MLAPLVYIRVHYASQIDAMAAARGEIRSNAQVYGARTWEYLLPAESHPVLKRIFGEAYVTMRGEHHGSNSAEFTINLSLTLIALVAVAAFLLWRNWRRTGRWWPKRAPLQIEVVLPLLVALCVGLLAFAFSLPPKYHGLPMPTYFVTALIAMWRVFARLYVLVNISLVILSVLALASLWPLLKKSWQRVGLIALLFVGVAFEYQVYTIQRPVWSFRDNTPTIYYRLAQRADIKSVAEYSLDEQPQTAMPMFYQTYQWVHGKALLNSGLSTSPQMSTRQSLRDLEDPQTLPALRKLGIQAILVHGIKGNVNIPGLELIDYEADVPSSASKIFHDSPELYPIGLYRVLPGAQTDYVTTIETGFVYPAQDSYISYDYVGGTGATISLHGLRDWKGAPGTGACFLMRSFSGKPVVASIRGNQNQLLWTGQIDKTWQPVRVTLQVGETARIWIDQSEGATFMLDDLNGCSQ